MMVLFYIVANLLPPSYLVHRFFFRILAGVLVCACSLQLLFEKETISLFYFANLPSSFSFYQIIFASDMQIKGTGFVSSFISSSLFCYG